MSDRTCVCIVFLQSHMVGLDSEKASAWFSVGDSSPKAYALALPHDPQQCNEEFGGEWENYSVVNPSCFHFIYCFIGGREKALSVRGPVTIRVSQDGWRGLTSDKLLPY